jgi:hypothetical protein
MAAPFDWSSHFFRICSEMLKQHIRKIFSIPETGLIGKNHKDLTFIHAVENVLTAFLNLTD